MVRRLSGDGLSLRRSNGELRRWITLAFSADRTLRLGSDATHTHTIIVIINQFIVFI